MYGYEAANQYVLNACLMILGFAYCWVIPLEEIERISKIEINCRHRKTSKYQEKYLIHITHNNTLSLATCTFCLFQIVCYAVICPYYILHCQCNS